MTISFRDVELLSAYLDKQLNRSASARLESRLARDASLRILLADLRVSRQILHELPKRRAPRSFLLTPKMTGLKPPEPRSYPIFRFATGLAFLLFIMTFAVNGLAPLAAPHLAAAPAPALGLSSGGPAAQESAPAATVAPAQPFSGLAPPSTEPPAGSKNNATRALGTPAEGIAPGAVKPAPLNSSPGQDQIQTINHEEVPVPFLWQLGLGIITLVCGVAAWVFRQTNERNFRRHLQKK
jgi:hypothetical protein